MGNHVQTVLDSNLQPPITFDAIILITFLKEVIVSVCFYFWPDFLETH